MTCRLVVVDPALGFSQGHHIGALINLSRLTGFCTSFIGGFAADPWLDAFVQSENIGYSRCFSQPTYELSPTSPVEERMAHIMKLAEEYLHVFSINEDVTFLHHSLSWSQAQALAIAIAATTRKGQAHRHIAFLMFNPGVDHNLRVTDALLAGLYAQGLRQLTQQPGVLIFASCAEYAGEYRRLLGSRVDLPVHPLFIDRLDSVQPRERTRHLLYLGDPKQEKGFARLPQRLVEALGHNPARQLLIHYTQVRDPALRQAEQQLIELCNKNSNVTLQTGVLDSMGLATLLNQTEVMTLDYDVDHYAEKTSGLVWLAGLRDIRLKVPANTWLERELTRLQDPQSDYREKIYAPFGPWLEGVMEQQQ